MGDPPWEGEQDRSDEERQALERRRAALEAELEATEARLRRMVAPEEGDGEEPRS